MKNRDREMAAGFLLGLVVGGTVGASLVLLMTPQTGPQTREQLYQAAREWKDRAEKLSDRLASKLAEGSGPPEGRTIVEVDPAVLAGYAGEYQGSWEGQSFVTMIVLEDDHLVMKLKGLWGKSMMYPLSEATFLTRSKGGEVEATFVRNGDGPAGRIDFNWAGIPLTVERVG